MKRFSLLLVAFAVATAVLLPGAADAQIIELGQTSTPISSPSCPKGTSAVHCYIILTRTSAVQSRSDGVANPTRVTKDGWIVAFTVGLSQLSSNAGKEHSFLHTLDQAYGGVPMVALTVLKPGPKHTYTVTAQSGDYHLIPFLGQVLQEPLSLPPSFKTFTSLRVKAGDVIALTVPTWAPVLTYNLSTSKFSYQQSRRANCTKPAAAQTAQVAVGSTKPYLCDYTGTRVEYSATEVVDKPYPKRYPH